jgi:plasmid stability protein
MKSTIYIRNVDDETKRLIRIYAAQHGVSLAEALKELVEAGQVCLDRNLLRHQ